MKICELLEIVRTYHLDENKEANLEIWEEEAFEVKIQYVSDDRIVLTRDM